MRFISTCFLVLLSIYSSNAQATSRIQASKPIAPINFDGKVDEPFWDGVPILKKVMQSPTYGNEPSERTETRLAYDDEYIYLAGKNYVSKPEYIRGTTFKRDPTSATSDYFGMVIDSYLDKENGVAFFTSANAFRWDGTVVNDAVDGSTLSVDWNTFWDVKTHITDTV